MRYLHLGRLPLVIGVVVLVSLAGQGVFQVFVAQAPAPAFYLLNGANLAQLLAIVVLLMLLINSNTRRVEGSDPNRPHTRESDAFGWDTERLLHEGVQLPDGKPYGRRRSDDLTVVARLTQPPNAEMPLPPWVQGKLKDMPQDLGAALLDLEPSETDEQRTQNAERRTQND